MKDLKNIYLLPTTEPSRIHTLAGEFGLTTTPTDSTLTSQLHVYITSSEKIEEGDWFIYADDVFYREEGEAKPHLDFCKKIILTTNPSLQAGGVQEIDDEFIQWLVKNPKCEFVKTYLGCCGECDERLCEVFDLQREKPTHKIIIPMAKSKVKANYSEEDMIEFHKWAYQKNIVEESDKTTKELLLEWRKLNK